MSTDVELRSAKVGPETKIGPMPTSFARPTSAHCGPTPDRPWPPHRVHAAGERYCDYYEGENTAKFVWTAISQMSEHTPAQHYLAHRYDEGRKSPAWRTDARKCRDPGAETVQACTAPSHHKHGTAHGGFALLEELGPGACPGARHSARSQTTCDREPRIAKSC